MKITYDPSVDAAYVLLSEKRSSASFGFTYACESTEIGGEIHLDFDMDGRLTGIEVLQASKMLPPDALELAETLTSAASPVGPEGSSG
jgi:uncharacterized protein YuzE